MSMDKRWQETFARLESVENAVREHAHSHGEPTADYFTPPVTKEELMEIKGVGAATADAILELIQRKYFTNG